MIIEAENIKYHIEIRGEGKSLVCLHGFSEDISTWNFLKLNGYQLILIDLIGHGKSEKPHSLKYYEVDVIIKHLNIIIKELDIKNYSILGYSMGGRIALAYAIKYQNKIDKLILESASYGEEGLLNRLKRRRNDFKLARTIEKNGIQWFNQYWSNLSIFNSQKNLPIGIIDEINKRRLSNVPFALANTLKSSGQGKFPCLKKQIMKLSLPILYISGEYDKKYEEIGKAFEKLNSNVKHAILNNCGHNTHIEAPRIFTKILNEYL